jgi:uncharacterized membrane protein YhaH (DUF805 family)
MDVVLPVLSGVVFPTLMLVVKRHHAQRPKEWESFFLIFGLTVATGMTGIWLFSASQGMEGGGFARVVVGFVAIFVVYGAIAGCMFSWEAFKDATKGTDP